MNSSMKLNATKIISVTIFQQIQASVRKELGSINGIMTVHVMKLLIGILLPLLTCCIISHEMNL